MIDNNTIVGHLDGNHGALYPRSNEFKDDGVPYVSATDFVSGTVDYASCKFLSEERANQFQKGFAQDGDVLFAHNATVGPVAILKTELQYVILSTTATYYRCNSNHLSNIFLKYALQAPYFVKQYQSVMAQSTRFQVPITAQRKFSIVLPELPEQTAIATALSDADALISSLEKLIEKKRAIKQGAMQELLKPKEGWVVKKLGEIADISGAGVDKKITPGELPITLVNYMDVYKRDYIYRTELNHVVTAPPSKVINCNVNKGDILLTPSSELRTDIGVSAIAMKDLEGVVYSYHLYRLRYFNKVDFLFGLYMLKTRSFLSQPEVMCEGSGKRYVVSMGKFRKMKVYLPKTISEQEEISKTLWDMDSEISSLEQNLTKYKMLKQGMMQELLTGKTRLI